MTVIIQKPDFSRAYSQANAILVKSEVIRTFPYSPMALVKEQTGIPCRSYAKARKYNLEMTDFGSESAVLIEYQGKSIIFYDGAKPDTHIRFSVLHEFGHYISGHDLSIKTTDAGKYHQYEIEANYFAAQLLMPEQIIREFQHRGVRITRQFLQEQFCVSGQAADKRIETLAKINIEWRSRTEGEFDDIILLKYANFLNKICCINNYFNFEDEFTRQKERDSWY